jgi:hypothetical protein
VADSRFTQTGLNEFRAAVVRFPEVVTARLKAVAGATAVRMRDRARSLWRAQRKGAIEFGVADAIRIREEADHKRFVVESLAPRGRPPMLPAWLEFGTVKMPARPYMRPTSAAEEPRYQSESAAAAEGAARDTFGT